MPAVSLSQARVVRRWCSVVGALEGCLQAAGIEHSPAFIMGASGHAFRLNIEPTHICRTGPTVIDFRSDHLPLYNNLGLRFELRQHWTDEPAFFAKQKVVWAAVADCLDSQRPIIVWDADVPEFGLIVGREPRGGRYLFSTMPSPAPWLGSKMDVPRNVGMLRVFLPVEAKSSDPHKTAYDAIAFALRHSRGASSYENHLSGFAGYEAWIEAIKEKRVLNDPFSHAYTVAVVAEARASAPAFLREVSTQFEAPATKHILRAADQFDEVAAALQRLRRLFPVPRTEDRPTLGALSQGVLALEAAYAAEQLALEALGNACPEAAAREEAWSSIA